VWEGKYDEYGQRREVDIAGCAMPYCSKIESIDEPVCSDHFSGQLAATEQRSPFEQQNPRVDDLSPAETLRERNRLFACVAQPFWGDNKLVMASLMRSFKGKVDLIDIAPTFDVGADFSMSVAIGELIYDR
jgi:adenine-specific DNA-methyltransferase